MKKKTSNKVKSIKNELNKYMINVKDAISFLYAVSISLVEYVSKGKKIKNIKNSKKKYAIRTGTLLLALSTILIVSDSKCDHREDVCLSTKLLNVLPFDLGDKHQAHEIKKELKKEDCTDIECIIGDYVEEKEIVQKVDPIKIRKPDGSTSYVAIEGYKLEKDDKGNTKCVKKYTSKKEMGNGVHYIYTTSDGKKLDGFVRTRK